MHKTILASVLLLTASVPAMAQDYNWSGPYIGASLGGAWSDASVKDTTGGVLPGPFNYSTTGFTGSGLAGYNYQIQSIVFGVEGSVGYLGLDGKGSVPSSVPGHSQALTLDGGFNADITARVGILVTPTTLVYGKGGYAYFDGSSGQKTNNPGYVTHTADGFSGYVVGGGVEQLLTSNISVRIDYSHYEFGDQGGDQTSVDDEPKGYVYRNTTSLSADAVRAGLAWHF